VWTGNPGQDLNIQRSCDPAHFARLAAVPGTAWYCLQKEADDERVSSAWPADSQITALGPMLHDFADTAAVIQALDLVISVDTSVAHLAGALGRPAWVLLSHTPDWRWQLDRSDSAWYPTMRLFRQPRWGDWDAVFELVEAALRKMSSERRCERI
jgi:ADP-heptose:LPS heptosyltransferase